MHHGQAMLERHFLEQVLEQECLVGQQQRIAVQQIDLELADAHFMHEGIARQAQCRHAGIDLTEERPQTVVGTDAERRMPILATTVQAKGRLEGLGRIGIGCKHEEFQLGRHHWRQAASGVPRDDFFELAPGGKTRAFTTQLIRIANRQRTWLRTPGQAMNLLRVGSERQVAVVTAVKTRGWIATHDALQQHPTGHLQTPPFEEPLGGHHLAPWHAVQIRSDTFNLVNARQSLSE